MLSNRNIAEHTSTPFITPSAEVITIVCLSVVEVILRVVIVIFFIDVVIFINGLGPSV